MSTKSLFSRVVSLVTLSSFLLWNLAAATPQGANVVAGSAAVTQSGTTTTINQASQNAVINWSSFNTNQGDTVRFNQPNASAIALNKIYSGQPTTFNGNLSANGQVWIVNPNGIVFGSSSNVNVAGLVATTMGIKNSNFMAGNYQFYLGNPNSTASVINNGTITIADDGIAALVAPNVVNNGTIVANLGMVALSTGTAFTLDMYGDNLIDFGTHAPIANGSVSNTGLIQATGGKVFMTANYAAGVLNNIISMSGTIEAQSVGKNSKGEIVLYGGNAQTKQVAGTTRVTGTLDTSDSTGGNNGGSIETSGYYVDLEPTAVVNPGAGGSWLLDPNNIDIIAGSGVMCTNPMCSGTTNPYIAGAGGSTVSVGFIQFLLDDGVALTLDASGNIDIGAPIVFSQPTGEVGSLILVAGYNGGAGNITMGASITDATTTLAPYSQMTFTANGGSIFYNAQFLISNPTEAMDITLTASNAVQINAPMLLPGTSGSGGYLTVTAPSIVINTPTIQLGGFGMSLPGFDFKGPVTLDQSLAISSNDGGESTFSSTVNAAGPGVSLTVTGNTALFIGDVGTLGTGSYLSSLSLIPDDGVAATGSGIYNTVGDQTYTNFSYQGAESSTFTSQSGTVTFEDGIYTNAAIGGAITINGNASFAGAVDGPFSPYEPGVITVTGTTSFNGATVTSSGEQDYKGAVTILSGGADLITPSTVLFESAVNGPGALTTDATVNTQFNATVGASPALSAITIMGPITLNSAVIDATAQTYESTVNVLAGGGTLNAAGAVMFSGGTINGPGSLTINDAGAGNVVTLSDAAGTALNALSITADSISETSSGAISATTLESSATSGADYSMGTNQISDFSATNTSGDVNLNNVGPLTITGISQSGGGSITISSTGAISQTGVITVSGASTLITSSVGGTVLNLANNISNFNATNSGSGDIDLTNSGALSVTGLSQSGGGNVNIGDTGNITFPNTVNGSFGLTATATGTVEFDNPVSLNYLTVSGNIINIANTASTITTSGAQQYTGTGANPVMNITADPVISGSNITVSTPLVLTMDTTYDSTGFTWFQQTVDGPASLTVNAGTYVEFDGAVGGNTPLNILTLTAPMITLNTPEIISNGDQTYTGSVVLEQDMDSPGGIQSNGTVTFNGTVDGAYDLYVVAPDTEINGNIGNSVSLASLILNSFVINVNSPTSAIMTSGDQTLGVGDGTLTVNSVSAFSGSDISMFSNLVLAQNTTFTATGAGGGSGNLNFDGTIDSLSNSQTASLVANPNSAIGGTASFQHNIGANYPLTSLTVNGTSFLFSENDPLLIYTIGSQIYKDTVTLGVDVDMYSTNSTPSPVGTNVIQFCSASGAACPTGTIGVVEISNFELTAVTNNSNNGSFAQGGQGITGSVNVASLTLGGPGGAMISSAAVQDSTVGGAGGEQARVNTMINPDSSGAVYCVNGYFCTQPPVPPVPPVPNTVPNDVPQTQIFNVPVVGYCDENGCSNIEIAIDNLMQSGVVDCNGSGGITGAAASGCSSGFGFAQATDLNGDSRILMPGDPVYYGDKISKDMEGCVCIKNLYSDQTACMKHGDTKYVYNQ